MDKGKRACYSPIGVQMIGLTPQVSLDRQQKRHKQLNSFRKKSKEEHVSNMCYSTPPMPWLFEKKRKDSASCWRNSYLKKDKSDLQVNCFCPWRCHLAIMASNHQTPAILWIHLTIFICNMVRQVQGEGREIAFRKSKFRSLQEKHVGKLCLRISTGNWFLARGVAKRLNYMLIHSNACQFLKLLVF